MLASAILTVETGFLIALGNFSGAGRFDFRRARNSPRRERRRLAAVGTRLAARASIESRARVDVGC